MALFGHSGSHTAQLMHSSVIIKAMKKPPYQFIADVPGVSTSSWLEQLSVFFAC
jgi:hypothetical protein